MGTVIRVDFRRRRPVRHVPDHGRPGGVPEFAALEAAAAAWDAWASACTATARVWLFAGLAALDAAEGRRR